MCKRRGVGLCGFGGLRPPYKIECGFRLVLEADAHVIMGSANAKEMREQKEVAPLHEGEFAIPDLVPELREMIKRNDGVVEAKREPPPAASSDAAPRYVNYRIRLTGNYELRDAQNEKLADLYRDLGPESKHTIALKSKMITGKKGSFRYVVRFHDSYTAKKEGIRHDEHGPAIGVGKIPEWLYRKNGGRRLAVE